MNQHDLFPIPVNAGGEKVSEISGTDGALVPDMSSPSVSLPMAAKAMAFSSAAETTSRWAVQEMMSCAAGAA